MIDFFIGALSSPRLVLLGTFLGFLAAFIVWVFLPESVDRASIAAWAVALGFVFGLVLSATTDDNK